MWKLARQGKSGDFLSKEVEEIAVKIVGKSGDFLSKLICVIFYYNILQLLCENLNYRMNSPKKENMLIQMTF